MTRIKSFLALGLNLVLATGLAAAIQGTSPSDGAKPSPSDSPQIIGAAPMNEAQSAQMTVAQAPMAPTPPAAPSTQVTAGAAPLGQVVALASGDNHLTTNGPIPDTPANRALYGKSLSHAGRRSPPDGN